MSALVPASSPDLLAAFLTSAALKGALLLLAVLLLDFALRRHTAALRHRVWTAAFAALLLVPLAVPLAPGWSMPLLPAHLARSAEPKGSESNAATRASQPLARHEPAEPATAGLRAAARAAAESGGADALSASHAARSVRAGATAWAAVAIVAWGVGASVLLAQLAIASLRAARLCARARRVDDPAWNDLFARVCRRLDLRATVALVCSDSVQVPMAWGIRRHHVVLPADAEGWSHDRREVVLLHELAHIRRADCLAHLLSGLAVALYWPNPLVWLARRRQVAERELACDDAVLASGACGADYAWHLLEIARASGDRLQLAPAGVTMARKSQLEGRLLAALDSSRDRRRLSPLGAAAPTVAGVLIAVALAGLQPWAPPAAQEPERTAEEPASRRAGSEGRPARERAMQMFVGLLDDPDVSIRRQAVHSLGQMEDAAAVAALSQTLIDDDDEGVRAQAAWALGMIESSDAVAALGRALGDIDANVRGQAAWALGRIESVDAVAALVTTLQQDADAAVREQAAWALGMIEDEAGLEAVIDAVEDENAGVRRQALWAVSRIVG